MIRGTTPTLRLTIKDNVDLSMAKSVYVSITQKGSIVEFSGDSLEIGQRTVKCFLTQADSMKLHEGGAKIQVNWTYEDGSGVVRRNATKVKAITIDEQLLNRVI